jgi:hypothetical protein
MIYTINCPLQVWIGPRKKWIIGLNEYRKSNHFDLNRAKIAYLSAVRGEVIKMEPFKQCEVFFTVWRKDNRSFDIANICSVHEKFLMDALVTLGKIPDDDYLHVTKSTYMYGGIDKENPRVAVAIVGE